MKVYSLEDAQDWFLEHATGAVTCVRQEGMHLVKSFPEAEKFFDAETVCPDTFDVGKTTNGLAWIRCLGCGLTSYLLGDIARHYCGHCRIFHDDLPARAKWIAETPKVGEQSVLIAAWRLGTQAQAERALGRGILDGN